MLSCSHLYTSWSVRCVRPVSGCLRTISSGSLTGGVGWLDSIPLISFDTNRSPGHQMGRSDGADLHITSIDPITKGFEIKNRRAVYGTETARNIKREVQRLISASRYQQENLRVSLLPQTTLTRSTTTVAASSHYSFLQRFIPTMKNSTDGGWGLTMGFGRMLAG